MWPKLKEYVEAVKAKKVSKPETKSYALIETALQNPLNEIRIHTFISIAKTLNPFLRLYQTDLPMIPFLSEDLHRLLKQLMYRFLKKAVVDECTVSKLVEMDVTKPEFQKKERKIDSGFTADTMLNHLVNTKEVDKESATKFRQECKNFLSEIVERLLKKAPVKFKLVRDLSCLDPRKLATEPDACLARLKSILVKLAKNKKVKPGDCDMVLQEFQDFIDSVVVPNRARFVEFHPTNQEDRVDKLYYSLMSSSYPNLWRVISHLLLISHGQASVERGFSVNGQVETVNLQCHTFVALRHVIDHVRSVGGIQCVNLSKELLRSCSSSRQRYQEYLNQQAIGRKADELEKKRKHEKDEVERLQEKKRRLEMEISDLVGCADEFAKKAETEKQFSYLIRSNALRDGSTKKKGELKALSASLDEKVKSLNP